MEPSPKAVNEIVGGAIPRRDFLVRSAVTLGAVGGIGAAEPDPRAPVGTAQGAAPAPGAPAPAAPGTPAAPVAGKTGRYNGPHTGERLNRIAFPLGGMGAGMLCLEGTGALSHFSLRNRPEVFNEPCT